MMIGELAASSGLSVRTLRFYADAGVLPETGRAEAGYRVFGADAVARARLVRTLRELGVGLNDIARVLAAEASLVDIAAEHVRALDAQIRLLHLRRAVLRAFLKSADPTANRNRLRTETWTTGERVRATLLVPRRPSPGASPAHRPLSDPGAALSAVRPRADGAPFLGNTQGRPKKCRPAGRMTPRAPRSRSGSGLAR